MDLPNKPNPALNTEKAKALQAALAQIEKQFGKGTIMKLGAGEVIEDIQVVSTGSLGLDIALGVGGLPRGRVVEIYGPESSGKTTLTLQVIAEMQKIGGTCAFVDAEHALDIQYAQKLGVNLQDLLISQPDTGEQALEIVDSLVRSGAVDLIVIDSVAALTPKAELEGEMGDSLPGLQARLMSQALRKLTAHIKKANCMVIFIKRLTGFDRRSSVGGIHDGEGIVIVDALLVPSFDAIPGNPRIAPHGNGGTSDHVLHEDGIVVGLHCDVPLVRPLEHRIDRA